MSMRKCLLLNKRYRIKKGSIYNKFLFLIVAVIIVPMILFFSALSAMLIARLNEDHERLVKKTADSVSQVLEEAVGSVLDTSISLIGNIELIEFFSQKDTGTEGYFSQYSSATDIIKDYYMWNQYISRIDMVAVDGNRMLSSGDLRTVDMEEEEQQQMALSNGTWFWSVTEDGEVVALCRPMRNKYDVDERLAYIKIILDQKNLFQAILSGVEDLDYDYAVYDRKGKRVTFSTTTEINGTAVQKIQNAGTENSLFRIGDEDFYWISTNLRSTDLIIVAKNQSLYYKRLQLWIVLLILLLFAILSSLYIVLYKKNIADPLANLGYKMTLLNPGQGNPVYMEPNAKG